MKPSLPSRRTVLKLIGGSVAGIFFTPVPWRVLGDAATWTQTGPWVAKNVRGPVAARFAACTLCPTGCGVAVRSVAGVPFQVAPVAGHPLSGGTLCPAGIAGHHLAWHPSRLAHPLLMTGNRPAPVSAEEVAAAARRAIGGSNGRAAIVTALRGSAVEAGFGSLTAGGKAALCDPPASVCRLDDLFEEPVGPLAVDFAHVNLILSVGTPMLDGVPAAVRGAGCRIIQAESRRSRTAKLADEWLPITPGSEAALAYGIAHLLVARRLCDENRLASTVSDWPAYKSLIDGFTPERTAGMTGLSGERIVALAHELAGASVVLAGGSPVPADPRGERAMWGLNVLIGSIGTRLVPPGGDAPRRPAPLTDIQDGSLSLLLIDASAADPLLPPALIAAKMRSGGVVVRFTPFAAGTPFPGEYRMPVAAPYEALAEAGTGRGAFAVGPRLLPGRPGDVDPLAWTASLFGETRSTPQALRGRADAIHAAGKGDLFRPASGGTTVPLASIASSGEFWKELQDGGVWIAPAPQARERTGRVALLGRERGLPVPGSSRDGRYPVVAVPYAETGGYGEMAPLMTKIYQESSLRPGSACALMHPSTASDRGLADGSAAVIETAAGSRTVTVKCDAGCLPGTVELSIGLEPGTNGSGAALALIPGGNSWNAVPAQLRKVV